MNRFLNWLGRKPRTYPASAQRSCTFRPQLEPLDERLVPSLSSAISILHVGPGLYQLNSWTERDWYATTKNGYVLEFQGTNEHALVPVPSATPYQGGWTYFYSITELSASVDPNTGNGEVFGIGWNSSDPLQRLFVNDSTGQWHYLGGGYGSLSASRDGHVYAVTAGGTDICYLDSKGNVTDVGAPQTANGTGVLAGSGSLAASVGWFGGNEVFAIGRDGAIYVNSTFGLKGWRLVDNHASFTSLSATPNDTVFAVTNDGRLFQETEHFYWNGYFGTWYWTSQDISGGLRYSAISADTDASGGNEVYAIQQGTNNADRYDQGSWTWKDADVYDIAAAGGGYFYDVNYYSGGYGTYVAWLYNPNNGWTYLGTGDFSFEDMDHLQ
jgi:hypothetical protein